MGSGVDGDVYLVKTLGKEIALKREKVLEKNKDEVPVEKPFYEFIDTLKQSESKYFVKLYGYRTLKCAYKHALPKWKKNRLKRDKLAADHIAQLQKSKFCREFLMELAPGVSIEQYVNDLMHNNKAIPYKIFRDIVPQLCEIMRITRQNGWIINDLHPGNIILDVKNHTIKLIDYTYIKYLGPPESLKNPTECMRAERNWFYYNINIDYLLIIYLLINSAYIYRNYLSDMNPGGNIKLYIKAFSDANREKIFSMISRMNPNIKCAIDNWKTTSIDVLDKILEPYFTCVAGIFAPEEDLAYWNRWAKKKIPDIPMLLPKKDLIKLLENYNATL